MEMPTNKPAAPKQHSHALFYALIFVSLGLVVIAFGAGLYWSTSQESQDLAPNLPTVDDEDTEEEEEVVVEDPEVVSDPGVLTIDWLPVEDQVAIEPHDVFERIEEDSDVYNGSSDAFVLGDVAGGIYDNYTLTYQVMSTEGLGTSYLSFYILMPTDLGTAPVVVNSAGTHMLSFGGSTAIEGDMIELINTYARDEFRAELFSSFTYDTGIEIPEFSPETSVVDDFGRELTYLGLWHRTDFPDDVNVNEYPVAYTANGVDFRLVPYNDDGSLNAQKNHFFYEREDGRLVVYEADIPFWEEAGDAIQVPDVTLFGGGALQQEYFRGFLGGCGINPRTNVVNIDLVGDLSEFGAYPGGTVFKASDYSSDYYEGARRNWMTRDVEAQEEYPDRDSDEAHQRAAEELAALTPAPFFYYEDDFGRWIEFTSEAIVPAAECGKPVIYLYPEETTRMSVYVDPKGGFTKTEPAYNGGWDVTATPESVILNHGDGQVYPYLFWEGRGGSYVAPDRYWVISQEEVPRFLAKTLRQIGFEGREVADFMEFWVPLMQEDPYYKVGFHGNEVMDELAPLNLTIEPDSILRILMDFEGLDEPIESNPPKIIPFEREGFAVTEWGGVIQ